MLMYDTKTATATVELAGELDLANKQVILDRVARLIGLDGVRKVALDMSAVTFLDSTALEAMIAARRICLSQGRDLVVSAASPTVARLLQLTAMDLFFSPGAP
jgi:anti-anti-sigma factor